MPDFIRNAPYLLPSPTFGTRPILDSIVLSLAFDAPYGACSKPINIYVYELAQDLSDSVPYYTSTAFAVKTPAIGQLLHYIPDFVDSVNVYQAGGYEAPQLRIDLSKAFGYKLLNADSVNLLSNATFIENVLKRYLCYHCRPCWQWYDGL